MSVTSLMGVGSQALFAAYRQVHTVGNNIANANTDGYSRQSVTQAPSLSLRTGYGYVGTGVTTVSIERAANLFLQDKASTLASTAAGDETLGNLLGELELVFGGGKAGLGNAATQVFSAFADITVSPGDLSARQAVLGRLDDFAGLARAAGSQLQLLQDNVKSDLAGSISEVNSMARQVAALNVQIQNAMAVHDQPNDLLDRRDLLVGDLAKLVDLQAYTYGDGGMGLFVAGGQSLVLGAESNQLVMQRDALDPTRNIVNINIGGELTLLAGNMITGGRIGGLLEFQDNDLLAGRNRLGQMVTAVATAINDQQHLGLDLYGQPGADLFTIPAPQSLAAVDNRRNGDGNPIATIELAVVDAAALEASDYELLADPNNGGEYILTRLSDGLVRSGIRSGDVVDGLSITDGPDTAIGGERFLLRAVAHVAPSLQMTLRDPKAVAAASPVVANLGQDNQGSMTIARVDIVAPAAAGYAPLSIRFTDTQGRYEVLDDGGGVLETGQWEPGATILHDGIAIQIGGVPGTDDRIEIDPTLHISSSNGNALTMANMGDWLLVSGQRVGDAYASLFADMGVRAQSANIAAQNSGLAASRASEALSAQTGVNLDEEAARLIQHQQSYQAAAKVLQTAQTMIDTILGLST